MSLLDLLFPHKCLGCGETGSYFCSNCLNYLTLESQRICPVCERPSIGGITHPSCSNLYSLDGLTSIFSYQGVIKKGIIKLKYKFLSDLASDLAEAFLSFCGEDKKFRSFCEQQDVYLVPIPLHHQREKWRGFNQSELLGKMIAKNLGIGFEPNLLVRIKNTTSQAKLKEKERKENIKGAFDVKSEVEIPLNVFLFDDVWTSGATLKEAGRVLKKSGARKVWGLTLAR